MAAKKILNEVYAINYKTLAYQGSLSGRLKISIVSTGKYVMPYFLSDFMKINSGVDLVMDVTNKARVVEILELNEVDFVLVSVLSNNLKIYSIELISNRLFYVGSKELKFNEIQNKEKFFEKQPLIYIVHRSSIRMGSAITLYDLQ